MNKSNTVKKIMIESNKRRDHNSKMIVKVNKIVNKMVNNKNRITRVCNKSGHKDKRQLNK